MNIKKLIWRDNITKLGKEKGLIAEIGEFAQAHFESYIKSIFFDE